MKSILTVTTRATSSDLTTLQTVKTELGIEDASSDKKIRVWIKQASGAISDYCNRVFAEETVTEEFWPSNVNQSYRLVCGGAESLQLARYPVSSIASVVENSVILVDGTDYRADLTQGALYRIVDTSGTLRRWSTLPISVSYTAGYALLDSLPYSIERACITMVKQAYFAAGRDPLVMSDNLPGVRDVRYWVSGSSNSGAMTPDVTDLLDNFRVPVVA